jgi:hypothetical protein
LRDRVGTIEEEDRDLLVRLRADVHAAVYPVGRLVPVRLAGLDVERVALATVAILDGEAAAAEDDGYTVVGITMPRHRLAGLEKQAPDECRPALDENVLCDDCLLGPRYLSYDSRFRGRKQGNFIIARASSRKDPAIAPAT